MSRWGRAVRAWSRGWHRVRPGSGGVSAAPVTDDAFAELLAELRQRGGER